MRIDQKVLATKVALLSIIITFISYNSFKAANSKESIEEAERKAYSTTPEEIKKTVSILYESHEGLKEKAENISKIIEENQKAIILGNLFFQSLQ
ncbi:MAG: hypothetical protein ACTFAL_04895 [Candidatus Electronema sp. V4]|uniref:hypothetical protein n=1 Tax=Candidatus Electronema sp. V4 TaxID=3454756 RepID=UPI0040557A46